ncbi:glycerol-3-phosphate dehydrogenase/oxidase [Leptolyngbya cf. ectocarpi LEGE 11479]|uniref:Glycerol-3-phosphate dehydrogenase/oxidase n=1 Tax=Leptolyngbya cf. ectocarpi LEGE 11479 TaxID=1828722 RepID=A0A929F8V7_LEPEC|nr:glycerol-3-phosphate dehydrogenase/oxidase [Leptolyngbya ectocarpi]MBE9069021.1 glycerol-3-phosphate dehydrogenase/oxidase [Leptolyngbya cf. ectocarpi LEGE 11479]
MQRDLQALSNSRFDLLVLGGGIQGACVAWEATLRGLSVALIDQSDFGAATSANSLKIIHGGLRYLQTADIRRMRQSIRERQILMRIAPHLVHPLPVLVPIYGHGLKGKEAMFVALKLNDWISCDRNRNLSDPQKQIPPGQMLSRQRCQQQVPGIDGPGLTGAATFHDAQVYNSERLTLAFVKSAAQAGAVVANYVAATGFLKTGNRVSGITAHDRLTGNRFEIQANAVINTSGPWLNQVLGQLPTPPAPQPFAKAINVVLRQPLLDSPYAVAFKSSSEVAEQTKSRMLFVVPWRGTSMVGTLYSVCDQHPDSWQVHETEIHTLLEQINQAYAPAQLTRDDVTFVHGGLLPQTEVASNGEPILAKRYRIQDHSREGHHGLLSVTGVKYTTSRSVAQKVVDYLFRCRDQTPPPSCSATTPLIGGAIDPVEEFVQQAVGHSQLSPAATRSLVYNYGSEYGDVFGDGVNDPAQVLTAQVRYAIAAEMAQTLKDVIFRRTKLGSAGEPDSNSVRLCAEVMAQELGWSQARTQLELKPFGVSTSSEAVKK